MSDEQETKTDVKKTLTKVKYDLLIKGSQTWKTFDKNAEGVRTKFYAIGKGLDVIYSDLKELLDNYRYLCHCVVWIQYFAGFDVFDG